MTAVGRVLLFDPAVGQAGRAFGNRVTALRWCSILRQLGLQVRRRGRFVGDAADLLVALHAARSADTVRQFRSAWPRAAVVVAVTGTDLNDPASRPAAEETLALADAVVVLHELALDLLPAAVRPRAHVVLQSVRLPQEPPPPPSGFQVCVLANLRPVKDPLLVARAMEAVPASSSIRAIVLGDALEAEWAAAARAASASSSRFAWLGPMRRRRALRVLQGSHVLVNSSQHEGGANAVGEAIVAGVVPVVSAIPGSLGLLGADWPAAFPVGDAAALAALLLRLERDVAFGARLHQRLRDLAPRFGRARELASWRRVLGAAAPSLRLVPEA
ncbi:MAG: glycosyltransferase [Planctomycetota bacterium]